MVRRPSTLANLAAVFAVIVMLGFSTSSAQSGRRGTRSTPQPVQVPPVEATIAPPTSPEKPEVFIRFMVGIDQYDSFSTVTLSIAGGVHRTFAQRLDEPDWAKVAASQKDMSRSEAIKLAKADKDAYVVLLRIREDTMGSRNAGTPNNGYNNAYIEFTVFAPVTAKVFATGSTYPSSRRGAVVDRRTTGTDGDYYLNRAAREAADRVLTKFTIPLTR